MATRFAGINRGAPIESVTFDTSTTSKTVEITYVDTAGLTKDELRDCITKIVDAMDQNTFPAT